MRLEFVKHHTVIVNGIKIHYAEAGNGPPVFLLHGFPETWFCWRKQIPVLAIWGEDFELVAKMFDVMKIWQSMGNDVQGVSIPQCGHIYRRRSSRTLLTKRFWNFSVAGRRLTKST